MHDACGHRRGRRARCRPLRSFSAATSVLETSGLGSGTGVAGLEIKKRTSPEEQGRRAQRAPSTRDTDGHSESVSSPTSQLRSCQRGPVWKRTQLEAGNPSARTLPAMSFRQVLRPRESARLGWYLYGCPDRSAHARTRCACGNPGGSWGRVGWGATRWPRRPSPTLQTQRGPRRRLSSWTRQIRTAGTCRPCVLHARATPTRLAAAGTNEAS